MATESVAITRIDQIDDLAYKAIGIMQALRRAGGSDDMLPQQAVSGSCWAVEGMIRDIQRLAVTPVED